MAVRIRIMVRSSKWAETQRVPLTGTDNRQCLAKMIMQRHAQFVARTVFVNQNNVEEACRTINRIMGAEGWFDQFRRTRRYEKPFQTRRRTNYEKCKAIYNEDMARKIQFVMRTNRLDPFPGCS